VPDVTGQTQDVALRTLSGAGLKPTVVQVASLATEVGRVVGTDPARGQQVDTEAVVTMRVGRGPDLIPAPSLVGQTADEAAAAAQGAGLSLTAVPQQLDVDDPLQVGRVLAQDPPPGTPLAPGQAIALTVGRLRENVAVPDVTGQTESAARSTLESVGFTVTVTQVDGTGTAGTAVGTSPAAGTSVGRGTAVTLQVSLGNERSVPSLIGLTTSQAVDKLVAAGFTGGDVQQSSQPVDSPSQQGKILSQQPAAGGTAKVGDSVSVVVGRYSGASGGTTTDNGSGTPGSGSGDGNGNGLFPNGLFPGGN
jgi:serine/threonine-protein kinase